MVNPRNSRASGPLLWPDLTVANLIADQQRFYESEKRPYAAVYPSQMRRIVARLGSLHPSAITTEHIRTYKIDRLQSGVAKSTVNRELEGLRVALRRATKTRRMHSCGKAITLLCPNDVIDIEMFRCAGCARSEYVTPEEFLLIAQNLRRVQRDVVFLIYCTGWRVGAVLDLRWGQVDWSAGLLRPKGGQPNKIRGVAPIHGPMRKILKRRWYEYLSRAQCGSGYPDGWEESYVLTRASGKPVKDISHAWRSATRKANREGLQLRDLRASAITLWDQAGIPLRLIMEIAGHKDPATTLKHYRRLREREVAGLAEKLERLWAITARSDLP